MMEQPDDDDVDINMPSSHDMEDNIMSDDESEICNFYLPLMQDDQQLDKPNNKTANSSS